MIMEMRVYRCLPGRLPALMKRFVTLTLKLWEKHGIKQAGFFTTLIGTSNNELTYFVAWDSLAERDKKWNAFQADPEWMPWYEGFQGFGECLGRQSARPAVWPPGAFRAVSLNASDATSRADSQAA